MTLESILRRLVITGLFAAPFIVFLTFSSLYFPFISGKNFTFRIIIEVIFGAWTILALLNAAYRPKVSAVLWTLIAFVLIVFAADLTGVSVAKSIWSNFERMEGFVGLFHFFLYFLVAGSVLTNEKLWERWFQTSIVASVIMAGYGILQLMGAFEINQGGVRVDGTFGNAAYFAVYMLFHFFLTAFLLARYKGKAQWVKWAYGIAMLLQISMVYFSGTRGAMIGLAVGVFLSAILIAIFEKRNAMLRRASMGVIAFVIVIVGIFIAIKDVPAVRENPILGRLASISLTEQTTKSRFMVWGMAVEGFKERPLLGWGQENFNFVFNKYYNPGMYAQEQWFDRAHNIFFDWLIAAGILGLLAYLALFALALYGVWTVQGGDRSGSLFGCIKRWFANLRHLGGDGGGFTVAEKSILTGLLAAYFIHNFFVFDNFASYLLFFSFLAYMHFRSVDFAPSRKIIFKEKVVPSDAAPAALAIVALVIAGSLYFVNIRPLQVNASIIEGIKPQTEGPAKNLEYFKTAVGRHPLGRPEAREQLVQMAIRIRGQQNIPQEVVGQFYDMARTQIILQNEETPLDARYESFAGMLFIRFGIFDEAETHLQKAHEVSPKKQAIYFDLLSIYLNKGDVPRARALAREAYELEPAYVDAAKIYATALIYNEEYALADELLLKHFGTTTVSDENLANAYAVKGQFEKAVEIFNLRVKENPTNGDMRLRLASGLAEMGRFPEAIGQIRAVIELHPEFKERGESYIKELERGNMPR